MFKKFCANTVVCTLIAMAGGVQAQAPLSDDAQRNILSGLREAVAFKQSLSPAERKLGTDLVVSLRQSRGLPVPAQLTSKGGQTKRLAGAPGRSAPVYRITGAPSADLKTAVASLGGKVRVVSERSGVMTASLPTDALLTLAQRDDVQSIQPVRRALPQQVTSAGAVAHKVDQLATARTGAGVVIGVISEPVDPDELQLVYDNSLSPATVYTVDWSNATAADQETQSGAWSGATNTAWAAADGGNAALAMLQVLHEIAPDATLVLTSYGSDGVAGMESAIDALANPPAGAEYPAADIVVDDLFFFDQSPFQDDVIAQAAAAAVAGDPGQSIDPVLYVTSAGDFGNQAAGTASSYEADYVATTFENTCDAADDGCNADFEFFFGSGAYSVHDFEGSPSVTLTKDLSELCLFWSEPLGAAGSDYDLFIFDANGQWVDVGNNYVGDGTSPKECVSTDASLVEGNIAVVAQVTSGSEDRFLHLSALPLEFETAGVVSAGTALSSTTGGAIRGQAGAADVLAVGAANVPDDGQGTPVPFAVTDAVAAYSADGSRRVFFAADGSPYTADDLSATGGELRSKPDIVAADGISLDLPNESSQLVSSDFFGTSAGAAHAAGLAALLLEEKSDASPSEIAEVLRRTAVDLGDDGVDPNAGSGAADVQAAAEEIVKPAPVTALSLTGGPGSVVLDFAASPDDYSDTFTYSATCTATPASSTPQLFDDVVDLGSDLPLTLNVVPDSEVSCSVTATDPAVPVAGPASTATATALSIAAPASVTVSALSAGASLSFTASPDDQGGFTYNAVCLEKVAADDASGTERFNGAVTVGSTTAVQATPGTFVECSVTPTTTIDAQSVDGASRSAQAEAGAVAPTAITLSADAGGFSVAYTLDANIADPDMLGVLLSCTADGQAVPSLTDIDLVAGSNPAFFEADPEQELACIATTTLSVDGVAADPAVQPAVTEASVTPDAPVTGLPIWLLYQATQQSQPETPEQP